MRMLLGLDAPPRGRSTIGGRAYAAHSAPLTEVGGLREARSVHPGRTVYDGTIEAGPLSKPTATDSTAGSWRGSAPTPPGGHTLATTVVLIVTTFDLDRYAYDGLRAGASGFLIEDALPEELLSGIRAVASGDAVVAPGLTRRLLGAYMQHLPTVPGGPSNLDARIATLIGRESERLHLAESTVKTHVTRILAKTGSRDRVPAVILAYGTHLVTPV
ncbi:hypothetical protein GA0115254_126597 [Streptomyces sp. Ncost-T10-10d]|nr:hypothetical protein GA0115254_126597 [Streptomyces sp. Ncost-T10-10d]